MRLMPQTLAARTFALLLLGLVLAQLLSTAIDTLDRGKAFYRSTTLQVAERIADIALTLDAVRSDERAEIVRKLSDRAFVITLSSGPQITDRVAGQSPSGVSFRCARQFSRPLPHAAAVLSYAARVRVRDARPVERRQLGDVFRSTAL